MEMVVILPEALPINPEMPANFCFLTLIPDENGNITFPTEAALISLCRVQWSGDWEFNRYQDHQALFTFLGENSNNGSLLSLNIAAVESPPTEESAPPLPPVSPPSQNIPTSVPSPPSFESIKPEETKLEPEVEDIQPTPIVIPIEELELPEKLDEKESIAKTLKAKRCIKQGVWVFTKSGLIQICDSNLKVLLVSKACTGRSATPTFPWIFKAQRFKPGYTKTRSGLSLYFSVFFFKGLAIAGVDTVSSSPCSSGSVLTDKKSAKKIFSYLKENDSPIWVRNV
jgi:hypothetical protein